MKHPSRLVRRDVSTSELRGDKKRSSRRPSENSHRCHHVVEVDERRDVSGRNCPDNVAFVPSALCTLGDTLVWAGKPVEAKPFLDRALNFLSRSDGPDGYDLASFAEQQELFSGLRRGLTRRLALARSRLPATARASIGFRTRRVHIERDPY